MYSIHFRPNYWPKMYVMLHLMLYSDNFGIDNFPIEEMKTT